MTSANKTTEYLQRRRSEIQDADYSEATKTAIIDFLDAFDPDSLRLEPPILQGKDRREQTLSGSSRLSYASTLHRTAKQLDTSLVHAHARELNRLANERLTGEHESVKDSGLAQNTVHQNQVAWRAFARFHQNHPDGADLNVDPDEIILVDRDDTKVDERDMFDPEEIEAMRAACQNQRDRALLEMLIYTGQRHNALRMLRLRDVQPDEGESGKLYIPDSEGMKGADGKRPLLGAEKAAREWKRSHPTGDPDDAFFTHIYDWSGHDDIEPGNFLSKQAFGRITKRIAKRAGVEKPANPHQFRHYFVTMAISNHGMSMDTVRHLIGHNPGSRELERTYQHLVDEDYIENAEIDMGISDERNESLTPAKCPQCDEPLEPHYRQCPACPMVFSPKVESVREQADTTKADEALEATSPQAQADAETVMELLDDPEVIGQLARALEERDADSVSDATSE
mgnify:CR=1 FL=1